MTYPAKYRYTREHEWVEVDGKSGRVGITDYAQRSLGDIVFVDLPKPGAALERGKVFGSVESVKAVSDLYAPVSGTVTEINEELAASPEMVNTDAHGAWMLRLEISKPEEAGNLLTSDAYEAYVKEESH